MFGFRSFSSNSFGAVSSKIKYATANMAMSSQSSSSAIVKKLGNATMLTDAQMSALATVQRNVSSFMNSQTSTTSNPTRIRYVRPAFVLIGDIPDPLLPPVLQPTIHSNLSFTSNGRRTRNVTANAQGGTIQIATGRYFWIDRIVGEEAPRWTENTDPPSRFSEVSDPNDIWKTTGNFQTKSKKA